MIPKPIKSYLKKLYFKKRGIKCSNPSGIDKNVNAEKPVSIASKMLGKNVSIGKYSYTNRDSIIHSNVEIGRYCSIGYNAIIAPPNHPIKWLSTHPFQYEKIYRFKNAENYYENPKTVIENDVWIGANVIVVKGVRICNGAIIGANSVVLEDVGPYEIYAGSPAKFIRKRFSEKIIKDLLELQWWNLKKEEIERLVFKNAEKSIIIMQKLLSSKRE